MRKILSIVLLFYSFASFSQKTTNAGDDSALANGKPFVSWEKKTSYTKVYYVDQSNPNASDSNSGTEQQPFKTINAAAQRLKPGEKVIIGAGIYREHVIPLNGGESPEKMISYEAAADAEVIVSGSVAVPGANFEESRGWLFYPGRDARERDASLNVWQLDMDGSWFMGYNPFGMANVLHDLAWLDVKRARMDSYFKRRGMLFVNGELSRQVAKPIELKEAPDFSYWIEHNGMRLHLKLPAGSRPDDYEIEITNKEQVFAPTKYGLGYIRLSGITFRHAGNGFPVPQRGLVSASRGHHWIIEDCTIEWANSLGIDLGNESWSTEGQPVNGYHIIRRNKIQHCGIAGLECMVAPFLLMEDNWFHNIGWQNAEHAFESGGVKLHQAHDCLIRRNLFTNISHAPGLWLDYKSNRNCRITSNSFYDITTARGGIYIEVSRGDCLVDKNIFYKIRSQYWLSGEYGAGGSAFYTDGSDSIRFTQNLILDAENTGYGAYLNAERMVDMRGGITCYHQVTNNLFIDCGKHAIEFANPLNKSDYNLFANPKPGYIKLGNPAPPLLLDIEAAANLYGWDANSKVVKKITHQYDEQSKTIRLSLEEPLPFKAGPFPLQKGENSIRIDPRNVE